MKGGQIDPPPFPQKKLPSKSPALLGLRTNMSSLEFRLTKIDETRNYFLEEINHNDLVSEKLYYQI